MSYVDLLHDLFPGLESSKKSKTLTNSNLEKKNRRSLPMRDRVCNLRQARRAMMHVHLHHNIRSSKKSFQSQSSCTTKEESKNMPYIKTTNERKKKTDSPTRSKRERSDIINEKRKRATDYMVTHKNERRKRKRHTKERIE